MILYIDPDRASHARGNLAALIASSDVVPTVFGYRDADPATGPTCGRCGRLEHNHLWQAVDNGQVVECEVTR